METSGRPAAVFRPEIINQLRMVKSSFILCGNCTFPTVTKCARVPFHPPQASRSGDRSQVEGEILRDVEQLGEKFVNAYLGAQQQDKTRRH